MLQNITRKFNDFSLRYISRSIYAWHAIELLVWPSEIYKSPSENKENAMFLNRFLPRASLCLAPLFHFVAEFSGANANFLCFVHIRTSEIDSMCRSWGVFYRALKLAHFHAIDRARIVGLSTWVLVAFYLWPTIRQ